MSVHYQKDTPRGLQIMHEKCVKCHEFKTVKSVKFDRWEKVYPRMARKAKLSESESALVWNYVLKTYDKK